MPVRHDHPDTTTPAVRAVVVAVQTPERSDADIERSLAELEQLLCGLGITVITRLTQRRARPDGDYVGEGKLAELARHTGGTGQVARGPQESVPSPLAGQVIVVADDELSPAQYRALESATGVEVLDRVAVILRVFEARARTKAARLEVERAWLVHALPRVRDDHALGDREGGGGRASRGASNVELKKQRMRARILAIDEALAHTEPAHRRARTVAVVGYTNAGKSSLVRALTERALYVEDKLFATLGITARQLSPPVTPPIAVIDTVGFMQRLPHATFAAFRSTFQETVAADLVLHVVDVADPAWQVQRAVTDGVLDEIGAPTAWLILNKADRIDDVDDHTDIRAAREAGAILMSALDEGAVRALRDRIVAHFHQGLREEEHDVPWAKLDVLAAARSTFTVVDETWEGNGVRVRVRGSDEALGRFRRRLDDAG